MSVNRKIVGGGGSWRRVWVPLFWRQRRRRRRLRWKCMPTRISMVSIAKQTKVGYYNFNKNQNDSLSSVKNQTPYGAAFWYDVNQKGHRWDYKPWMNDSSFWWKDHDEASSYGLGHRC